MSLMDDWEAGWVTIPGYGGVYQVSEGGAVSEVKPVYVAGPVTGRLFRNRLEFEGARVLLSAVGLNAVIPHDHVPRDATWDEAMGICLPLLTRCGGVALLDGWEGSRGARLEYEEATRRGMDVRPLNEWVVLADEDDEEVAACQTRCSRRCR